MFVPLCHLTIQLLFVSKSYFHHKVPSIISLFPADFSLCRWSNLKAEPGASQRGHLHISFRQGVFADLMFTQGNIDRPSVPSCSGMADYIKCSIADQCTYP